MKNIIRRGLSLLLALVLALCMIIPASAVSKNELSSAVKRSAQHMLSTVKAPQVGSIGGEWVVIGLARSGCDVPQEYCDNYYAAVEDYVEECKGVLHKKKYTEYSRVILALTAIGADPADVAGYNLLMPLGDFDKTVWQGINGPIWALIALDSGNYDMPVNVGAAKQATRQMYIDEILSKQLPDGGWNLTSKSSDPDLTGMALQALAKYRSQTAVKAATEKALECLSKMQDSDGGFSSWDSANSESVVQVIVALCELGIDLNDPRFVKNGNTLLDNLLGYQKADGSFSHTSTGSGSDQMASEQGFYGIVAALRVAEGKSSLYRMSEGDVNENAGLPGKHPDVKKAEIVAPGKSFADINGHENQKAIEALIARGIINGMGDDSYAPDMTMTRAQFATIVVKALGLAPEAGEIFSDVPAAAWYAPYIGTAYKYGIVNGRSATSFDPGGTITRQEAALMLARAAKLCGMETELESEAVTEILSSFSDGEKISAWARNGVAFCVKEGIWSDDTSSAEPTKAILRCDIAQMLYNMLEGSNLL